MTVALPLKESYVVRELLATAWLGKWKLLAWNIGIIGLFCFGAVIVSPKYESKAVLIIPAAAEYMVQPVIGEQSLASSGVEAERVIGTEVALIDSDDLHRKVISELGIDRLYPAYAHPGQAGVFAWTNDIVSGLTETVRNVVGLGADIPVTGTPMDKALVDFDLSFTAEAAKESNAITLTFRHKDPAIAQQVLDTLQRQYIAMRRETYLNPQAELADTDVSAIQRQFEDADRAVETFKAQNAISNFATRMDVLLHEQGDLERDLQDAQAKHQESQARVDMLQSQLRGTPSASAPSHDAAPATTAPTTAAPSSPVIHGTPATDAPRPIFAFQNSVYQNGQTDLMRALAEAAAARARRDQDTAHLGDVTRQIQSLTQNQHDLQVLEERRDSLQENYRDLSKLQNERQLADSVNAKKLPAVHFVESATRPTTPRPTRELLLLAGLVLALIGSLAIVVVAHYRRNSYLFAEILEQDTDIPVLAIIPYIPRISLPAPPSEAL